MISFITKKDEGLLDQFNKIQQRNEKLELVFKGKDQTGTKTTGVQQENL